MTKMTLDPSMVAKLKQAEERIELCDESGHTLGFFTPLTIQSSDDKSAIPFTDEELKRFAREPGRFTTEEVLAHLRGLEQS